MLQGLRFWRVRDRRAGQLVLYILPALSLALLSTNLYYSITSYNGLAPHIQRAKMLADLEQDNERHVILVKYGPSHSFHNEWVFNEADIDAAKVVWARDMELPKNCELLNYFKDRVIWSLNIDHDEDPVKLHLYPKQSCLLDKRGA